MKVIRVTVFVLLVVSISLAAIRLARQQKNAAQLSSILEQAEQQDPHATAHKITVLSVRSDAGGEMKEFGGFEILDNGELWATKFGGTDYLYHSLDGGETWLPVRVPSNGYRLSSVSFLNANLGFAVNHDGLLRTTDGGHSWQPLTVSTPVILTTVHFVNPQLGFVGGQIYIGSYRSDNTTGQLEILCTKDGGDTWQSCYREKTPGSLFSIVSLSQSSIFAALDGRRLLHTTDQGKTWKETSGPNGSIMSLAVAGNGSIWRVGGQGNFQYSKDEGNSWHPANLPPDLANQQWEAIRFNRTGGGIALGNDLSLAYTCDNGATWQRHILSSPESSFSVPERLSRIAVQGDLAIVSSNQKHYFLRLECADTQR